VRSAEADKYSRKLSIYRTVVEPSSPGGAQPKPFEQLVATGVQLGDEVIPGREATLCAAVPGPRKCILARCPRHVTADRCGACSCGRAEIHRFARQRGRGAEAARLVASASVGVLVPQVSLVFNDGTPLRGLISPQRGIITWSDKTMWGRNGTVRMACYAFVCARMQCPVHSSAHGCTKQLCPILPTDPVALHELVALLRPCRYTGQPYHTDGRGSCVRCCCPSHWQACPRVCRQRRCWTRPLLRA
jgi:hypothetical protein